jgi:hypothetical protein
MVISWNIQGDNSWGTVQMTFCLVVHPLHIVEIWDCYQKLYWIRSAQPKIRSCKISLFFFIRLFLVCTKGKGVQLCLLLQLAAFVVPEHSSFSLHHVKSMSSANAITVCRYSPLLLKCWCCKMVEVDAVTKEVTRTWKLAGEWNCQLWWQLNFTTSRRMVRTSVPYDCNMPVILDHFSCPSLSFRSMPSTMSRFRVYKVIVHEEAFIQTS